MKKILNGKVVVITGASSGIGEAMAREYAKMGAKVVMGARREEELQRIAQEIKAAGGDVAYAACDVVNEEECKHLIQTAIDAFGGIDVMICNAGLSMRALFDDLDLSVLHRLMDVNFWGTVYCRYIAADEQSGTLVIIYNNANIDLIRRNGTVMNITDYAGKTTLDPMVNDIRVVDGNA